MKESKRSVRLSPGAGRSRRRQPRPTRRTNGLTPPRQAARQSIHFSRIRKRTVPRESRPPTTTAPSRISWNQHVRQQRNQPPITYESAIGPGAPPGARSGSSGPNQNRIMKSTHRRDWLEGRGDQRRDVHRAIRNNAKNLSHPRPPFREYAQSPPSRLTVQQRNAQDRSWLQDTRPAHRDQTGGNFRQSRRNY